VAFHVVEILTPPSQAPATDFNARAQGRKAAKQITNDKFSMTNSQWLFSHGCGEVSEKKAMLFAFSAPRSLSEPPLSPAQKSSKTPAIAAICDPLLPLAAHSRKNPCPSNNLGDGPSLQMALPSNLIQPHRFSSLPSFLVPSATMSATIQRLTLFSSSSTLVSALHRPIHNFMNDTNP
jgi:hypothetical protein